MYEKSPAFARTNKNNVSTQWPRAGGATMSRAQTGHWTHSEEIFLSNKDTNLSIRPFSAIQPLLAISDPDRFKRPILDHFGPWRPKMYRI